jgi:hypothetical protein
MAATNHVDYTAGGTGHDMLAIVKFADVFADVGAADTGVALDLKQLAYVGRWGLR